MQQVSILRAIKAVNLLANKPNSHAFISNDVLYYWSKSYYISKKKAKKHPFKGWSCKEYKIIYDTKLTVELINKLTFKQKDKEEEKTYWKEQNNKVFLNGDMANEFNNNYPSDEDDYDDEQNF